LELRFNNRRFVRAHPFLAWFVFPLEAVPDYNFGYAQTAPNIGGRRGIIGNAIFNRMLFQNARVTMSFLGLAGNHTFQKAPPTPLALVGPVQFLVAYNSRGISQRDIRFTGGVPTARLTGPTADLQAALTNTRMGPLFPPQYQVNGFFVDQNGVNFVNLVTPPGGVVFNTRLATAPDNFAMPNAFLNIPTAQLSSQPRVITAAFFKAYYELRLE
jgi:hypothetical protein